MNDKIRCIDCVHCWDQPRFNEYDMKISYFCDAGSVVTDIGDPEKEHICSKFEPFIEDI